MNPLVGNIMTRIVTNVRTGEKVKIADLSPSESVISACAQAQCTSGQYRFAVEFSRKYVTCGNWRTKNT